MSVIHSCETSAHSPATASTPTPSQSSSPRSVQSQPASEAHRRAMSVCDTFITTVAIDPGSSARPLSHGDAVLGALQTAKSKEKCAAPQGRTNELMVGLLRSERAREQFMEIASTLPVQRPAVTPRRPRSYLVPPFNVDELLGKAAFVRSSLIEANRIPTQQNGAGKSTFLRFAGYSQPTTAVADASRDRNDAVPPEKTIHMSFRFEP